MKKLPQDKNIMQKKKNMPCYSQVSTREWIDFSILFTEGALQTCGRTNKYMGTHKKNEKT